MGAQKRRTFHFFPKGKGCHLPKRLDLEFSLGVQETSLRTIDSELGSESGSWSPHRRSWYWAASVTDGAQREFGLNVVCFTLQKQELETER